MICICVSVRIAKCISDNLGKVSSICSTNPSVVNMSDYYQGWGLLTLRLRARYGIAAVVALDVEVEGCGCCWFG
jgi:hypothetical protein